MAEWRAPGRALLLAGALVALPAAANDQSSDTGLALPGHAGLALSGYYKNLLIRSETTFPTAAPYTVDLNRLRLVAKGAPAPTVHIEVQYDHELLLGNYLRTLEFRTQQAAGTGQYWPLARTYLERPETLARHRLHRGLVTWTRGETDLRVGRQRIAWGTGRFFSPLDRLNPLPVTAIERDERTGVDALLVDHKLGPLSRLSFVHAPQHNRRDGSTAAMWHGNTAGIDWSAVWGRFGRDHLIGGDLATQVGDAGLRGELAYTRPPDATAHIRAVVGIDYVRQNTLTLSAEAYYNGAVPPPAAGTPMVQHRHGTGRRYLGLYAAYDLTPLLKTASYFVSNLADRSRYFSPTLSYSIQENLEWTIGAQWYGGRSGTEFRQFRPLLFGQLQYYF